jgi:hypothetical protein
MSDLSVLDSIETYDFLHQRWKGTSFTSSLLAQRQEREQELRNQPPRVPPRKILRLHIMNKGLIPLM